MKVYPQQVDLKLAPDLQATLARLRAIRNFEAESYINAKALLLNDYLDKHGLHACVIAVSGGVDSALVLALVKYAASQAGSPIKRIVPICLPVFTHGAASNQTGATLRGVEVSRALGLEALVIDLSAAHLALKDAVDGALGVQGNDWASGQLTANTRTPANYYVTSVLASLGLPAVLIGTTNRDEGAYFGYVGKASDAVVDVQLIADLHKSEVYAAAAYLQIPASVLDTAPAGDMFDGRTDAEVYGASYDEAELYLALRLQDAVFRETERGAWCASAEQQFTEVSANLDNLHRYNAHKYLAQWPGVFLNVLPSAIPGGWQVGPLEPSFPRPDSVASLTGMIELPVSYRKTLRDAPAPLCRALPLPEEVGAAHGAGAIQIIEGLLSCAEIKPLLRHLGRQDWFPVGTSGYESEYQPGAPVGSWRLRAHEVTVANVLWERLRSHLSALLIIPAGSSRDAEGALVWRAIGVSPLLRFIKYSSAGSLLAHYDAPYDFGNGCRTLKSVVLYLTSSAAGEGGLTRIVRDPQRALPVAQHDYSDWPRCAEVQEVLGEIRPTAGNALILDHRILHDSSPLPEAPSSAKLVLRTDIMYQAIRTPCAG